MNQTAPFPKTDLHTWVEQLKKDLKGGSLEQLDVIDSVEELNLHSYQNEETVSLSHTAPNSFPYSIGFSRADNAWTNGVYIEIEDEKDANEKALKWLMAGANYLVFEPKKEAVTWEIVFKSIGFEHIRTHFVINEASKIKEVVTALGDIVYSGKISFGASILHSSNDLVELLTERQFPLFVVNAFELHAAGSATFQELGFALNCGHEHLLFLMNGGLSIDQAAACIHFHFGVGSQYILESTKFNVFRQLWSKIISAYKPQHTCTYRAEISAWLGHMNKSLKDPYTNFLRQTTEAMSAANGGVSNLLVLPYDFYSTEKKELAQRMAINISLILSSESHLDKVIDPLGGSYVVAAIEKQLAENTWKMFLELESKGGVCAEVCRSFLVEVVKQKGMERISRLKSGEHVLIGINKYPNPESVNSNWTELPTASISGLNALILEKEIEK
jgi:methylmalonyl-CoA mutase